MPGSIDAVTYSFASVAEAGTWRVERFSLREALSTPYEAEVVLEAIGEDGESEPLLGQNATIELIRGVTRRRVVGIVGSVATHLPHDTASGRRASATVRVVPALRALAGQVDTRVFQEMTVPEILEEVLSGALGPYGRTVALDVQGTYPTREICMQYRETTLAFVERLMEEEGIAYWFSFDGDVESLTLTDRNAAFPVADTIDAPVLFGADDEVGRENFIEFHLGRRLVPTSTVVRTFDWTTPEVPLESEVRTQDDQSRDRETYLHSRGLRTVEQSGSDFAPTEEQRQAELHRQLAARDAQTVRGRSRVTGLMPGRRFTLSGHDDARLNREYVVTRVTHRSADGYSNHVECLPFDVVFRPDRCHPSPEISSVQTATVVGADNEEIHTDEHGRIRVQFHWDRQGQRDDRSMCWVRVSQRWSGAQWGWLFLPRVGMEVMVSFVDGCPDRPLVVGSLYNATNVPPYTLPDEKTKSTIKSSSSPGGEGFNELRFDDLAGSEHFFLHAQRNLLEEVLNNHDTEVGNDQTNTVDADQTQTIHRSQVEQVDGNQTMTVDSARTVHVKGSSTETIDSGETRTVTGGSTENISGSARRTVNGGVTETINDGETRTVNGGQTETINGALNLTINGGVTQHTNGPCMHVVQGGVDETATGAYEIVAPAGSRFISPGGHSIVAMAGQDRVDKEWNFLGGRFYVQVSDKATVAFTNQGGFGFRIALRLMDTRRTAWKVDAVGPLFENKPTKIELKGLSRWEAGGYAANLASIIFL